MKKHVYSFFALVLILSLSACKKDFKPEDSYIKIYDDQDGNKHFYPLSIASSENGDGYILLSAFDGWQIQIMKTDKTGAFEWNYELPENYVNAVPNLIKQNGKNYLVCMDAVGLFTYILQIDESSQTVSEVSSFSNVVYPTYAYYSGQNLYIQNYNRLSYETEIHRISPDLLTIEQSGSVNIFTDVEDRVVNHVTYIGKRIPFFVSSTPEQDYIVMNGFYNYSFSLVFMDQNLQFAGVYNGAGFNGGLAALHPSGNNQFALARFTYDNLYYNANASLSPTTVDIAESIPAQGNSELDAAKSVLIKEITIGGNSYQAFLASTRSNQLLLTLYENNGTLKAKKYLGKNIPLTACDFMQTEDEGLAILAQAKIMGSFDRIALMKLSKAQLEAILD